jgi:hypothetical protein
METNDQEKIEIAREYFIRADQGRSDILEQFHEDAEIISLNLDWDRDGTRFLKWLMGSRGPWNTFNTITTTQPPAPPSDPLKASFTMNRKQRPHSLTAPHCDVLRILSTNWPQIFGP